MLFAGASYACTLSGTLGWRPSLWKKAWQNEGCYLTISVALVIGVVLALVRFNPTQFMFVANVVQGILAPVLILLILMRGNSRKVMRSYRFGIPTTICLALAAATTVASSALRCFGLQASLAETTGTDNRAKRTAGLR